MKNLIIILVLSLTCFKVSANNIDCVVDSYTQDIGVRELTGNNDGVEVEQYLSSTGLGKGYAWCAAFVNYHLIKCGFETPNSAAWSPSWFNINIIYTNSQGTRYTPRSGDVFGLYFQKKKRIAHVGFVHEWPSDGKYITTVEGNTNCAGSREGDGVYKKFRRKTQIHAVSRWT